MVVGVAWRVRQRHVHVVACDQHTCRSRPGHRVRERDSQRFEGTGAKSESQFVFANYPQVEHWKRGGESSWERYAGLTSLQAIDFALLRSACLRLSAETPPNKRIQRTHPWRREKAAPPRLFPRAAVKRVFGLEVVWAVLGAADARPLGCCFLII